jgi:hypothetical protein
MLRQEKRKTKKKDKKDRNKHGKAKVKHTKLVPEQILKQSKMKQWGYQ